MATEIDNTEIKEPTGNVAQLLDEKDRNGSHTMQEFYRGYACPAINKFI